ncbi:MAG: DUF4040 domain-containing protein [Hyphomicrobiaceae bacterium]
MEVFVNAVLLTMLAVVTVAIARQRNLFGVIALAGIYSFLMASILIVLDAVDVAMTEASVGAGVSTVFFLGALHLTRSVEQRPHHSAVLPMLVAAGIAVALVWGTIGLPPFGTADAPIHRHVTPVYLESSIKETMVANVVSSVLASYRGYDTFGETTVVFTAALGVMLLLRGRRRKKDDANGPKEAGGMKK